MKCSRKDAIFRVVYSFLSVMIIFFIFSQSLKPGEISSEQSGRILAIINQILTSIGFMQPLSHSFVRVCAHFAEFFVLGISLCFTFKSYINKLFGFVSFSFITSVFVALVDECIQLFTIDRAFQIIDILIDVSGASIAIIGISLILSVINKAKPKSKGNNNVTD